MKGTYKNLWLLLSFLALSRAVTGQELLTLDSVFARIGRNPALLAFDAQASARKAYAKGWASLPPPMVSAGQYQTPYSLHPNSGSFMIQAQQEFTNPAVLRAKRDYLEGMEALTAADRSYLRNQLFADAKTAYQQVIILTRKMALVGEIENLLDYMLKDARIRLTYGKETLSNIYRLKAERYKLDNTREQISTQITENDIRLNTLMDRDRNSLFRVDTTIRPFDMEAATVDTGALAVSRSDIRRIDRSIALDELNANLEYSKHKPGFGLQVGHMISYGNSANMYVLMGSVTLPIAPWSSREYRANVKGIRYDIEEMREKRLDLLNQAQGELSRLRKAIASDQRQLSNFREEITPAMRTAYKTALLAYEQNSGSLTAVLDAIRELQQTRSDELDRLQDLLILQVSYEKEVEKY